MKIQRMRKKEMKLRAMEEGTGMDGEKRTKCNGNDKEGGKKKNTSDSGKKEKHTKVEEE